MSEVILRFTRGALLAAVCFFCLGYLGLGTEKILITGLVFIVSIVASLFRPAAILVGLIVLWAVAHALFGLPQPKDVPKMFHFGSKQNAAQVGSTFPFTNKLNDIKSAHDLKLVSDAEYAQLRAAALKEEASPEPPVGQ